LNAITISIRAALRLRKFQVSAAAAEGKVPHTQTRRTE